MYEVFDESATDEHVAKAFRALQGAPGKYVVVRLTEEDGSWDWLAKLQHDVTGAVRSFRYLADKVRDSYATDVRGGKVMESIERHVGVVSALQGELLDRLFGGHGATESRNHGKGR
jgi:hypothetical protein